MVDNLNFEQAAMIESAILANPGENILDIADSIGLPVGKFHTFLAWHPRGRKVARENIVAISPKGRRPLWSTQATPVKQRTFNLGCKPALPVTTGSRVLARVTGQFDETMTSLARHVPPSGRPHLRRLAVLQSENFAMIARRDTIIAMNKETILQLESEKAALEEKLHKAMLRRQYTLTLTNDEA